MVVMTGEWDMYTLGRNVGWEDPGEGVGMVILGLAFILIPSQLLFD